MDSLQSTFIGYALNKINLVFIAFLLSLAPIVQAQQVVIVPIRAYGQGENEASAVKDAIVQAVGQITGERINATSTVQTQSRETSSGVSEHSAKVSDKIESLIKGVVKSSNTVSVEKDPATGLFRAVVDVKVASFKGSAQLDRIKLAIVMGSQALPQALAANAKPFTQDLVNGISDKFVTSAKFAVLDRGQQAATQQEFSRISSGSAGVENYVRLQSKAIADFLVIVDISEFTITPNALGRQRVKAGARAMVYDYTSGQIRQVVTTNSSKLLRENAFSAVAFEMGSELAEKILDNVFPPLVIGFENNTVTVNAGNGLFEVGDKVRLSKQGAALKDPYTKEMIGYAETDVGEGVVESVLPKISIVRTEGLKEKIGNTKNVSIVVRRKASAATGLQSISLQPIAISTQPSLSSNPKKGDKNDDNDW
jgi:hypothetical protein